MKRLVIVMFAIILALSLAACGGGSGGSGGSGGGGSSSSGNGDIDLSDAVDDLVEEAIVENKFSLEAAALYWKSIGVDVEAATPDWDWVVDEEKMATYGDAPGTSYGHASIMFEKSDGGEISVEDFTGWARKVFAATAAASDDGYNIIGWEFVGEGEDARSEVTFETAIENWIPGWGFMKNGEHMVVYLGESYDTNRDSALGRILYHYGVSADIAVGMQKSFDELWGDMEDAFEEYGDEIEDALKNY